MNCNGMVRFATVGAALVGMLVAMPALAGENGGKSVAGGKSLAESVSQTMSFWTLERMQQAKPMPLPKIVVDPATEAQLQQEKQLPMGEPGVIPGWDPGSGLPQPEPKVITLGKNGKAAPQTTQGAQPQYASPPGSPPANPVDFAGYGPFQRWTHFGNYLAYPRSVIGKLFFKKPNGYTYVCTGTVVNRSTIITAGHCVSDGNGTYYSNFLFCPSYYKGSGSGSPHPSRGCWTGIYVKASTAYHTNGNIDRDYACIVTASTGTVHNAKIGDITGWAGISVNGSTRYMTMSFGYPAESPFYGYNIIQVAGVEWYEVNMRASDGNKSKYMGNDMKGGSSGGPWMLNWEHRNSSIVVPPLSGANTTYIDPFAGTTYPRVNGVNSHKRCMSSCGTPTSSSGTYNWEMGSPQFTYSSSDNDDVGDVLNACFNNGGS